MKLRGVDHLARRMAPAQNLPVYAYRFDWDEQATTVDGLDMAIAIGAARSTETAFGFGNWDVGFIDPDRLYDPATNLGRDRLSDAMMSYWANFAYTRRPGRGRDDGLPEWRPWEGGDGGTVAATAVERIGDEVEDPEQLAIEHGQAATDPATGLSAARPNSDLQAWLRLPQSTRLQGPPKAGRLVEKRWRLQSGHLDPFDWPVHAL